MRRGVWHRIVGTTKTEQSERFVTVTDELREILLDLWVAQGSPISGYILAGRKGQPVNLDKYGEALNSGRRCRVARSAKQQNQQITMTTSLSGTKSCRGGTDGIP